MTLLTEDPLANRVFDAIRAVCADVRDFGVEAWSWMQLEEKQLWRELVAGILGSRVRYEVALDAADTLDQAKLLEPFGYRCTKPAVYEKALERLLSGKIINGGGQRTIPRYPFPRQRAKRIRRAHEQVYGNGQTIKELLSSFSCAYGARRHFVEHVPGIGPKQASMFLRNIGFGDQFAVLDVHVLSYMKWALLPINRANVSLLNGYEIAEQILVQHVEELGLCPRKFDIALWVVVRVLKREFNLCLW